MTATWSADSLGIKADTTDATVVEPEFNENPGKLKDTVTITPAANVVWTVNGTKVSATGTTPIVVSTKGVAEVVVKAAGTTLDYGIAGGKTEWTKTFTITKGQLEPVAPTADNDAHAVKITQMAGVIWKVDGVAVKATSGKVVYVPVAATKTKVTVTATAQNTADAEVTKNASTELTFSAQ